MIKFTALPTKTVRAYQSGAPDAYGNPPERAISDGHGNPCRHCLQDIPEGKDMLIFAYRPFDRLQPYAETGPVFLCADSCERYPENDELPPALTTSPDYLIKGYGKTDRIIYGTGAVTPAKTMSDRINQIFSDPEVAYIHIRSARNNCYQARVDRIPERANPEV